MSTLGGPWGLIRDIPNGKDWRIEDHVSLSASTAPQGRPNRVSYMKNQRQHGACTAFMLERLMRMALQKAGLPDIDLSPLFGYHQARIRSGLSPTIDSGASIRGAIDAGRLDGLCREGYWTYANADGYLHVKPEQYAYDDAQQHQVVEAYSIPNNPDMIISALEAGFGVGLGATVFANAFELAFVRDGNIQMPQNNDPVRGAHAFVLDGWNKNVESGRYDKAGSWGEVGQKGFGTIPFDYVTRYGFDIWAVRVVESPEQPQSVAAVYSSLRPDVTNVPGATRIEVNGAEVWRA